MSSRLARMARALTHHWRRSLIAALAVLIALGGLTAGVGGMPADDFEIPGTESQRAMDLFRDHAPALAGADASIVLHVEDGQITDPANRAAVTAAMDAVAALPDVAEVGDPLSQVSPDGTIAMATVRLDVEIGNLEPAHGKDLEAAVDGALAGTGIESQMRGTVIDFSAEQEVPVGELIGVAIAIVLLTMLFRSAAAMAATLIGALLGVMLGQLMLQLLAQPLGLPEFATTIAIMLGLGAGIDYALLVIGRYREQVAAGDSPAEASARAAATAGSSVVAAGLIVMVAIAGLLAVGIPMVGKMGIGAAIGVAAVVVSSLTILPIMAGALARWLKPKRPEVVRPSAGFAGWGRLITARPWVSIAIAGLALALLAIPTSQIELGQPDDGNQPASATQRQAYDLVSEGFGPGANGPLLVAATTPAGSDSAAGLTELERAIGSAEGVAAVMPAAPSPDGAMATLMVIPTTSPQDSATADLVDHLRADVIPGAVAGTGMEAYVGGSTAMMMDMASKVSSRLPIFIVAVVALSVLLLMAAFRSLWIPLVSAVLNLLSIGAAYGVVVLVFQQGWGAGLVGAESGVPIVSFIPLMIFAILFGLSMDYNVFLLSRIREAYLEGDSPRESVIHGVSRIGKVILYAGLIMASVFLAFVTMPDVMAKMMGLGLGLAILIDVLVVRLVIVPAVVTLLGDRAWGLPRWLDRALPNLSLEGGEQAASDTEPRPVAPTPAPSEGSA